MKAGRNEYEGLVGDAERWTRRMLDFIGLPWDPRCLEFHQTERVGVTARADNAA
jgi:hypothetical protein